MYTATLEALLLDTRLRRANKLEHLSNVGSAGHPRGCSPSCETFRFSRLCAASSTWSPLQILTAALPSFGRLCTMLAGMRRAPSSQEMVVGLQGGSARMGYPCFR
eukprot:6579972-Pyramimonas_sp.AAC.2